MSPSTTPSSTALDVSVLIASRARPALLAGTLESLAHLDVEGLGWEVLVVDSGGHEATRAVAARYQDRLPLRLVVEPAPGKNRAMNRALPMARGNLIAFTDDDVAADPSWLRSLLEGAARWPDHGVFGGRVLPRFPEGEAPLQPGDRYYLAAYGLADWRHGEGPYKAAKVFGPSMAVRASVLGGDWRFTTGLGPNGASYVMGGETDFVQRLERAGHGAVYLPGALVHHVVRPEQLTRAWLVQRAHHFGRMLGYCRTGLNPGLVAGVPVAHLVRRAGIAARRILARSQRERLLLDMDVASLAGTLQQYKTRDHAAAC